MQHWIFCAAECCAEQVPDAGAQALSERAYCRLFSSWSAQASSLVDETNSDSSGSSTSLSSGSATGAGGCSWAGEKSFVRSTLALQSGHVPSAASPPCTATSCCSALCLHPGGVCRPCQDCLLCLLCTVRHASFSGPETLKPASFISTSCALVTLHASACCWQSPWVQT